LVNLIYFVFRKRKNHETLKQFAYLSQTFFSPSTYIWFDPFFWVTS